MPTNLPQQLNAFEYRLPRQGEMRVDGKIFLSEKMMSGLIDDPCLEQVRNVAHLPGIIGHSLAMPDIHWGYGFPIGGVAAFDERDGVVSPGGVGYDINCGVRLLRTRIPREDLGDKLKSLVDVLFNEIPCGVGSKHRGRYFSTQDFLDVLRQGAAWVIAKGKGNEGDLEFIEERGCLRAADPKLVSDRAKERGQGQLGTIGSGNHFVEVGYIDEIYDKEKAEVLGLKLNHITIIIHTGSRGLGHQVCTDYLARMLKAMQVYRIALPDSQLCCAPLVSQEAQDYLAAMAAAANFAFANRQMVTQYVRSSFEKIFRDSYESLGIDLVYDLCHNIAKFEDHWVGNHQKRVLVHRKGATRSFPAKHPLVPSSYRDVGQPVLIPGDMGRYSYVLMGTDKAARQTFGSTCHGAGRLMSRRQAKKSAKDRDVIGELSADGIIVRGASRQTVNEEVPWAYKDVADVVSAVVGAGLSEKVARLRPLGVIKG